MPRLLLWLGQGNIHELQQFSLCGIAVCRVRAPSLHLPHHRRLVGRVPSPGILVWHLHALCLMNHPEELKGLLRGWCLGSKAFRKELLGRMREKAGPEHYGEEIGESAEEKAQELVARELKRLRWAESELSWRRKGHAKKVKIALRLRRETTMTMAWIAERLQMGTRAHVTHLLYLHRKEQ